MAEEALGQDYNCLSCSASAALPGAPHYHVLKFTKFTSDLYTWLSLQNAITEKRAFPAITGKILCHAENFYYIYSTVLCSNIDNTREFLDAVEEDVTLLDYCLVLPIFGIGSIRLHDTVHSVYLAVKSPCCNEPRELPVQKKRWPWMNGYVQQQ